MNSKSILELKNIFSSKEQLSINQQFDLKGGEDKRRDNTLSKILIRPTATTSTTRTTGI
jgi:hypothetical protein